MRVVIVGTGVGIRTHLAGIQTLSSDGMSVVGVVGSSPDRARELLFEGGYDPNLATEWSGNLMRQADLICLTTPLDARADYLTDLIDFDGVILLEKPVANTANEIMALREFQYISRARDVLVNFQLRGLGVFVHARELVQSGVLGRIHEISLFERTSALRRRTIPRWMTSPDFGGGQRLAMGSHLVDLGVFLSGEEYSSFHTESIHAGTVRGEWLDCVELDHAVSDEAFDCVLASVGPRISVRSNSVSVGPRCLEFRVEGTEGVCEFTYREGVGRLDVFSAGQSPTSIWVAADGTCSSTKVTGLDGSVFRVAYPRYLEMLDPLLGYRADLVASLDDGLLNAARLIV